MGKTCYDCAHHDGDVKHGDAWCSFYRSYENPRGAETCRRFEPKGSGGCYLTTIMCDILGYQDDCAILNLLRRFRDKQMKPNPEYQPLLEDYDVVGPLVCEKLSNDENKLDMAFLMLNNYISPVIDLISEKKTEEAIEIYKSMTIDLMDYYGFDTKELNCSKKSIQRKRKSDK